MPVALFCHRHRKHLRYSAPGPNIPNPAFLLKEVSLGCGQNFRRPFERHHNDAIVISEHDISGSDRDAGDGCEAIDCAAETMMRASGHNRAAKTSRSQPFSYRTYRG